MPGGHFRGGETFKQCVSQSRASCDLENCAGQTKASIARGVNREDCTTPLKQTSAGAVWSDRGYTRSWLGLGRGLREQASAGWGWTQVTPRVCPALCVGLQRLQRREARSQRTFPVGWQERVLGTHPDTWGRTASCGRSACSSSPFGRGVAQAESRSGYESVSTRSPRPKKKDPQADEMHTTAAHTHKRAHTPSVSRAQVTHAQHAGRSSHGDTAPV